MGPSTGSPAAETKTRVFLLLGIAVLGWQTPAWADSADSRHTITVVVVNPGLSISDDSGDFSLSFERGDQGAASSTHVVNYRVNGNGLPASSLEGVVTARLAGTAEGIDLQADVGRFTNHGTPGNIELREHSGGFQTVGTVPIALADKEATSGTQARVLNGSIPVTWKAVATKDLPAGQHPVTLTVTLKDA